jgi:hypothetical protein
MPFDVYIGIHGNPDMTSVDEMPQIILMDEEKADVIFTDVVKFQSN